MLLGAKINVFTDHKILLFCPRFLRHSVFSLAVSGEFNLRSNTSGPKHRHGCSLADLHNVGRALGGEKSPSYQSRNTTARRHGNDVSSIRQLFITIRAR
jgi:hypothetical protein